MRGVMAALEKIFSLLLLWVPALNEICPSLMTLRTTPKWAAVNVIFLSREDNLHSSKETHYRLDNSHERVRPGF